ncbi:MAG: molybdate ABC transporter substrate-binding protein [Acidobacteriales bacterium]|nr:molybdate ABC transporter substrate-binding protein [Terriglobales bacterium]
MSIRIVCLSLMLAGLVPSPAYAAQEITVAAAADLQFAFTDVAARFEKSTGNHVKLTFGSSGNLFVQIQNGAPFDLFFSADTDYAKKLEAAGLIVPGTLYEYASGKLVIWVPKASPLDLNRGLQVLLDPRVKKIAIANPEHAPYGRAAESALKHAGVYDRAAAKLVRGENISQAATFVASGDADVGLLALSLALAPAMKSQGRFVEVAADDYQPIRQAAVVLKSSPQTAVARQFLEYVKSPEMVELLRSYGFAVPASALAAPLRENKEKTPQ